MDKQSKKKICVIPNSKAFTDSDSGEDYLFDDAAYIAVADEMVAQKELTIDGPAPYLQNAENNEFSGRERREVPRKKRQVILFPLTVV